MNKEIRLFKVTNFKKKKIVQGKTPLEACKLFINELKKKKNQYNVSLEETKKNIVRQYNYNVMIKKNGKIICKLDKKKGGAPASNCVEVKFNFTENNDIALNIDVILKDYEIKWLEKWNKNIDGALNGINGVYKYLKNQTNINDTIKKYKQKIEDINTKRPPLNSKCTTKVLEYLREVLKLLGELQDLVKLEDIIRDPCKDKIKHNLYDKKENCNFVIVTYWWGANNLNKNLSYPCPEDAGKNEEEIDDMYGKGYYKMMMSRPKCAMTYSKMIEDWRKSCAGSECYYLDIEYEKFDSPGMYQIAINAKPLFIEYALEYCKDYFKTTKREFTGVVYIDGDMTVNKFPHIFNMRNIDLMARGWNIDPRSAGKMFRKGIYEFDPYVFETSGGIMFFGPTTTANMILSLWHKMSNSEYFKGKADDRILSLIVTRYGFQKTANIIQLPIEYLWLTDAYGEKGIHNDTWKFKPGDVAGRLQPDITGDIIFEHPACLTGEERATEQGASTNRSPPRYYDFVTKKIRDKYHGGIFYNNIIFDKNVFTTGEVGANGAKETFKVYLDKISSLVDDEDEDNLPPYYIRDNYDKLNDVVNKKNLNIDIIMKISDKHRGIKDIIQNKNDKDDVNDIKLILNLLSCGYDVIYSSNAENVNILKGFKKTDLDLVYFTNIDTSKNIDEVHFKMDLIKTEPIFFSHKSIAVRHLLLMSEYIFKDQDPENKIKTFICDIYNSSYLFSSLIRTCSIYKNLWDTLLVDSPVLFSIKNNQKLALELSKKETQKE